jgi:serine/threonine protein kinase
MKTLQVGVVVGDYTVIDVAGAGGMGTVYKIEHVITKRIEAMKLLPPGLSDDPEQVRRFEREIRLQARLHHPNIVALYNAVRDGDSIALVMEFVEGESLQRRLAAGSLTVEAAVDFTIQVLRALAYAHEAGVIHRDVSPANIIITPEQAAKLTDFGLARGATDLRLSTSGAPLGSPWYMSPEQVRGVHDLDFRTDLYSMGAVLHEMLTGRKLFEAEGAFEVMRAQVEAEPQLPSALRPEVPAALDGIVKRAVSKDPAMRFQSAEEFRLALQTFAVDARLMPEPSGYRQAWHPMFSRLGTRLQAVRSSREAILLVLVPVALATGFCAVRFFPPVTRGQAKASKSEAAHISTTDAGRPSPVITPPIESQASEVVAPPLAASPQAPELPVAPEESTVAAPAHAESPTKTLRRPNQTARSTAIRVTGGMQPIPDVPTPRREPPRPVEAAETAAPKANPVQAPEPGAASPTTANSELETKSETTPASAQNSGNRLVRALGKVNPFRKSTKHSDAKDPPKQD